MKAFLIALLGILLLAGQVQAEQQVRITNGEWAPYLSQHLPHYGLASRIITEAFALEGVRVTYGFFPWKRSLDMARSGSWDATAVWHDSVDRQQDFFVSDPVLVSRYVFFHRADRTFAWETLEDIERARVGATLEYDYGTEFALAEKQRRIYVERVARDELNFHKLLAGRIDLFPMDQVVGLHMISNTYPVDVRSRLTFHPQPLRADGLHLLLSRKVAGSENLLEKFNRGLKQLHESGRIAQLTQELVKGYGSSIASP